MTVLYRCTHEDCRQRTALARRIEQYVRPPRCQGCGRKLTGQIDREPRRRAKRDVCHCSGYWFPHRKGSKWCDLSRRSLTDQDYEQRRVA